MRPTDENQTGSRRPNLMSSSRRTSGEINILAMLDGQSVKPRRFSGLSRVAWYGASGVLACALLGTAAWMVHEQSGGGFENRVPAGPAVVPLEIASETVPNPALRVDAHPAHAALGAAIVELPVRPPAVETQHAHADALALDEAHDAARMVSIGAPVPAPPTVAPSTAPSAISSTASSTASAPALAAAPAAAQAAVRPAAHTAPQVLHKVAPTPRTTGAQPRQAAAPGHARHPAAVARPKPAPAAVDTDVALISAIIQHVNQHGDLKDGKECGDKSCLPKMTNRP